MNDQPEPPPLPPSFRDDFSPLDSPSSPGSVLAALLKQPGRVVEELGGGRGSTVLAMLVGIAAIALALYGIVVGSLSGGAQIGVAPAKILLGSAVAGLICLPSLYVFLCMNGAEARLREVAGLLAAAISLMAVLLVSLAPIAWIFSQSTDSVALMATLHLLLWSVGVIFGLRLLKNGAVRLWGGASGRLLPWMIIYVLVCLQMMTALRPIIGTADHFLPTEKKFFVAQWTQVLGGDERCAFGPAAVLSRRDPQT